MKICLLVWQIPVIEGEQYNPIMYAIYMQKAKKFVTALNSYFQEKNMDWKCILDKLACTYDEIFSPQNQVVIFVPGAKTRQWLYNDVVRDVCTKKYYLDSAEYNARKIDKIIDYLNELEE